MSETEEIMSACSLCPRDCHVDRNAGKKGFCGEDKTVYLARAALHMWEEPCISGKKGSGAVFFSGCGLRCCFCQNHDIAIGSRGLAVTVERLSEIFLELQEKGAANINLGREHIMFHRLFRRWIRPVWKEWIFRLYIIPAVTKRLKH